MFFAIRYNHLKEKFFVYQGRIQSAIQKREDGYRLQQCIDNWNEDIYPYGMTGYKLFQEWFPYSKCHSYELKYPTTRSIANMVCDYLKSNGHIAGTVLYKSEKDRLTAELNEELKKCDKRLIPCKYPIKSLGSALKHFGFTLLEQGKHGTMWTIIEYNKETDK